MSRDNVLGVVIAAGAIVLAAWYLRKTGGGLLPTSTGLFSAAPLSSSPGSVYANGAFLGGGCGCRCNGQSVPNGQGYQATAFVRPAGNAPTWGGV